MTTEVLPVLPAERPPLLDTPLPPPPAPLRQGPVGGRGRHRVRRLWRGRPEDPAWVRPAFFALLAATAVLYLWDLGASGWGNSFYSAAVQAGSRSWKAFFFGSSDAANFITVDKPPASLWVMELSARLFGLSSWSVLVPQALEGVASVAVLYAAVRRWFRPGAGLLAGLVLATTPVAALMFRYNNPDALLVLLLTIAVYATVRALERANTWWLMLAMAAVGTGFITKMMQAFLVVPAIGLVYLLAAPTPLRRRLFQLAGAAVALVVSAGWWVAAVQLTPAADRPYIGGSQNNSILNLIFGYNGFGRLSGNESGSVGGGPTGTSMWGPTGWTRFFNADFGTQISWLIPAALVLMVACLWMWRRAPRTDRPRAAMLLWSAWLVVTVLVISFAQGIIHPYYTVAAAPAVAAVVGIGASALWARRSSLAARLALAAALGVTAWWAYELLDRAPTWMPWLRPAVLAAGVAAAVGLVVVRHSARLGAAAAGVGIVAGLAAPAAYAIDTATTPHTGAIPSAGPSSTVGFGGGFPGGGVPGGGFPGGGGAGRGTAGTGSAGRGFPGAATGGAAGIRGGALGAPPVGASGSTGPASGGANGLPGATGAALPGGTGSFPGGTGRLPGFSGGAAGRGGGRFGAPGGGGFLSISTPGKAVVTALEKDAGSYTWVAATVNSNSAAGYQLATDDPVMAIGGFNGTDPAPTLAQFERDVAEHKVHYFIPGGGGLGTGRTGTTAGQITSWVESHFHSTTVDGVTLYDLSSPTTSGSTSS